MASENNDKPNTVQIIEIPLEKAHTASEGHLGQSHIGGFTDAHQAQPTTTIANAQALAQAMGGFPSGGSAISDPNPTAQIQAAASNNMPSTASEPTES